MINAAAQTAGGDKPSKVKLTRSVTVPRSSTPRDGRPRARLVETLVPVGADAG
jgi:hypothetical protein